MRHLIGEETRFCQSATLGGRRVCGGAVTFPSQFGEGVLFKQTNAIQLKFPQLLLGFRCKPSQTKCDFSAILLQSFSTCRCFRFYLLVKMWSTLFSPRPLRTVFQLQVAFVKLLLHLSFNLPLGRIYAHSLVYYLDAQLSGEALSRWSFMYPSFSDSKTWFLAELPWD